MESMGGVVGNGRLTAASAVVLLLLLAAEGVTIVFVGSMLWAHVFIGMLLIPPVALKLASTGYRFVRYYTGDPPYRQKGPPPSLMRISAPFTVVLTFLVLASGVALLLHGPDSGRLLLIHKASFIGWLGFMSLHVLGHRRELPSSARADWRRAAPEAAVAGSSLRISVVAAAIAAGVVLALGTVSLAAPWLN